MSSATIAHERSGVSHALARFLDGVGDLRQLELLRIAMGPIVILHLWPFLQHSLEGIAYSDRFFQPYVSWYPEAPREVYFVLLWLAVVSAVALSVGAATRLAAVYTAAFVAYNLFLSQLNFVHNRAFLCLLLVTLALAPVGRRFSVDSLLRRRAGAPNPGSEGRLWPVLLLRFEIVCVFVLSASSKLIDPVWWGGTVTMLRFADGRVEAEETGVPVWLLDLAVTEGFNSVFAKVAVLTEFAIGIGLIFRRTRLATLWLEVGFHVAIEVVFSVQVFSYAALAAMVVWITPSARDRLVIVCGDARRTRLARVAIRWLDWTGRFVVKEGEPHGPPLTLVDRGGGSSSGRLAGLFVLTRLPALFPFVAPIYGAELLTAQLRKRRRPLSPA